MTDHLQKDLFVNMLETTIIMSYTYIGILYLIQGLDKK
jgi:hypothetical protein